MGRPLKSTRTRDWTLRRCLGGCGKTFKSEWAGNRICDTCKQKSQPGMELKPHPAQSEQMIYKTNSGI